jgi:hypothetical protein
MKPKNKPTPAAMRAARVLFTGDDFVSEEETAQIIDQETGLPELVAACEKMIKDYRYSNNEFFDALIDARKALAKVKRS